MWGALKTLVFALCTQQCAAQLVAQVVRRVEENGRDFSKTKKFGDALLKATPASDNLDTGGTLEAVDERQRALAGDRSVSQLHRNLRHCDCVIIIIIIIRRARRRSLQDGVSEMMEIQANFTITDPVEGSTNIDQILSVGSDGVATTTIELTSSQVNHNETALCDECTLEAAVGECLSGACEEYDMDATNANLTIEASVFGDPHMVGLLGQRIDWYGKDAQWYCLISDSNLHTNVRVSAPLPEEFPNRQLISGVGLLTGGGHSLVIEVKNPYTIETEGCSGHDSKPCLANGALRVLVDGEESDELQTPGLNIALSGGVVVSSANLPAECQSFGGDRVWATQVATANQMEASGGHRSLRASPTRFDEWLLHGDTLAAPTWCAKFLNEERLQGITQVQSSHAIFRVETPTATVRISIGVNYQDEVNSEDGTVLVPELEFWQTDLGFEGMQLSGVVSGMLGDTSRFAMDDDGVPIMTGLGALHGPVESYRVSGPSDVEFELHALHFEQG